MATMFYAGQTDYIDKLNILANAGATNRSSVVINSGNISIDISSAAIFTITLTTNITSVSFTNPNSSGTISKFILEFTANGTAHTIAWPSTVKWSNGTPPTMTSTLNKKDAFSFYTYDGGVTYIASIIGQNL